MKVHVDVSIYTKYEAVGNNSGTIDFSYVPSIGDSVSFLNPTSKSVRAASEFNRLLKVVNRVILPLGSAGDAEVICIYLEDLILDSREEALAALDYFEVGFGLLADIY